MDTRHNPISMAITLDRLEAKGFSVDFFGSMLFTRFVSGTRVVTRNNDKKKVRKCTTATRLKRNHSHAQGLWNRVS